MMAQERIGMVIRERSFGFGVFSDTAVQNFDGIGGVNDLPNFLWIVKISSQFLPVFLPGFKSITVF